jgi:hypothetical protein
MMAEILLDSRRRRFSVSAREVTALLIVLQLAWVAALAWIAVTVIG